MKIFPIPIDRAGAVLALCTAMLIGMVGSAAAHNGLDEHAGHSPTGPDLIRTTANYATPHLRLVRQDGKTVWFDQEMDDGRPVVLNFIYTTCTSICPLSSQTLSELQERLGAARDKVHLMSISIDPEEDTPARLRDYAKKFDAGPDWQHYTGTLAASTKIQRAFDVYRGEKMSHLPVTLVRLAPGRPWVRLDGFATADQLFAELHEAVALR